MVKAEGARGFNAFFPNANKKKAPQQKAQYRSAKEKKERIWGKTPQKPYISSSLGDMARVMMRYACMENTYFYNTEPPPVEFYDFWQKFSVENTNDPLDFVDPKRSSFANLKKNTSSFDFFGKFTAPIRSHHDLEASEQKEKKATSDTQKLSDIWKDVRISMSSESFISSSTKISEPGSAVPLETGWDEVCSEDYQSSESDYGFDVQDRNRHHRHKINWTTTDEGHDENKTSSIEFHTPQGLIDKQANAITQSILAMQRKDNKLLYDLATLPRDIDLIDHFADDLDDSFLADSFSYSDLPDAAFGPDFDFLNEDLIYRRSKKGKKGKKTGASKGPASGATTTGDGNLQEDEELDDAGNDDKNADDSAGSSQSECQDDSDPECALKKKEKQQPKISLNKQASEISLESRAEGQYEACLERRKKRIEDSLRAAVRCRSPMGSYRPRKGEDQLSKALIHNSPGPAAYFPNVNGTKPNTHTAFLVPRWGKNIYETLGPGPAAYLCQNSEGNCTCEMYNLHEDARFKEDETLGPGPANVNLSQYIGTAKDKPKAIIVSRKNTEKPAFGGRFTNCQNMTRFGRDNPPKAIILGKPKDKDKSEPGPGKYDPKDLYDTKVGITLKSRIPPLGQGESPGFFQLPDLIGDAPGVSFGIRNFMEMNDQSPGPIYQIVKPKPKPVSLTFRPFPMKDKEDDPSPLEWGNQPGKCKIKVLHRAPCAIIHGSHDTLKGKFKTPAPNQYKIEDCPCIEPGASFKGRYPEKLGQSPGPADYDPKPAWKRAPYAVFQHKWKDRKKKAGEVPQPSIGYRDTPRCRIVGGVMTPRWRDRLDEEEGPDMLNMFGMTIRGNKTAIPISLKSRHTPFKYSHMADPKQPTFRNEKDGKC